MNRFPIFLLTLGLALFGLISCQNTNSEDGESTIDRLFNSNTLPAANGGILDILVVAEDKVWNGTAGRAFQSHFTAMTYGLPQPEPLYTVRQVNPRQFSELLQRTRYVVSLAVDDSAYYSVEKNRWAKGQLVAFFQAEDEMALRKMILRNNKSLDELITAQESKRLSGKLKPLSQKEYPAFFEKHGLQLDIPRDFSISVAEEDLVVYWKRTTRSDNGIIIHVSELPAEEAIIGNNIIPLRDSITKLYVPGSREGSYMKVEDLIKPQIEATEFQNRFALETRGLWRTVGDIMGGPFVSYTIYDEENGRMIYVDTFMLAPEKKKRKSLFELESLIRELRIR